MTYPISRLAPALKPNDLLKELEKTSEILSASTRAKLEIIAKQVEHLYGQAVEIIEKAEEDKKLHGAKCGFTKRVGHSYFLYHLKEDCMAGSSGEYLFSLIGPEEWHVFPAAWEYAGKYKLLSDMSWEAVD